MPFLVLQKCVALFNAWGHGFVHRKPTSFALKLVLGLGIRRAPQVKNLAGEKNRFTDNVTFVDGVFITFIMSYNIHIGRTTI